MEKKYDLVLKVSIKDVLERLEADKNIAANIIGTPIDEFQIFEVEENSFTHLIYEKYSMGNTVFTSMLLKENTKKTTTIHVVSMSIKEFVFSNPHDKIENYLKESFTAEYAPPPNSSNLIDAEKITTTVSKGFGYLTGLLNEESYGDYHKKESFIEQHKEVKSQADAEETTLKKATMDNKKRETELKKKGL